MKAFDKAPAAELAKCGCGMHACMQEMSPTDGPELYPSLVVGAGLQGNSFGTSVRAQRGQGQGQARGGRSAAAAGPPFGMGFWAMEREGDGCAPTNGHGRRRLLAAGRGPMVGGWVFAGEL